MVQLAIALFQAVAAIPSLISSVERFAAAVALWYVQKQTSESLKEIADAAALAARAKTQEERHAALDSWRRALSRPRVK